MAQFRSEAPSVVTLDLGLPPDADGATEGFSTLEEILALAPETKVIVVTGQDTREHAMRAIAQGAYDFYTKPIDPNALALILRRAFYLSELEEENRRLIQSRRHMPLNGVITGSPDMLKICRLVEKVAPSDVSVLILGESGTGKELFARALHQLSERKDMPFSAINCAAIPENLIESELFGHEKGAFTGAIKQSKGKIELANRGTLFLDEVGDIPAGAQVKLLRFLQERVIERVGGRQQIAVDVRVVCATNQNLEVLIKEGRFREDLYYRLSELVIKVPPLRERNGDAELLAHSFLQVFNEDQRRSVRGFSSEALAAIAKYEWPGNVRELENRVKRAVIMAETQRVIPADLDLVPPNEVPEVLNLAQAREEAERREIPRALSRSEGNISQAAKLLGVSRPTLYDLMRQHNIKL
jgi:two-component system, NtrC family, response regulator